MVICTLQTPRPIERPLTNSPIEPAKNAIHLRQRGRMGLRARFYVPRWRRCLGFPRYRPPACRSLLTLAGSWDQSAAEAMHNALRGWRCRPARPRRILRAGVARLTRAGAGGSRARYARRYTASHGLCTGVVAFYRLCARLFHQSSRRAVELDSVSPAATDATRTLESSLTQSVPLEL